MDEASLALSEIERCRQDIDELRVGLERVEGFAAASFVLSLGLLREILMAGGVSNERAIRLVTAAIGALRRIYRVDEADPFRNDEINYDMLTAAFESVHHEQRAEELLTRLLGALLRRRDTED